MRLALAAFLAPALSRVTQLVHQASFLILGEGTGDLAHHLSTGIVAVIALTCWGGTSAQLMADEPTAADITCRLDPNCGKVKTRSFRSRGVTVEGEVKQEPLSVDLYVNFAFDSAELQQDAQITLQQLGTALKDPSLAKYSFTIAGHTDAKGSPEYNQKLSERRAEAVRAYLAARFAISPSRLATVGYGKSQLLNPSHPEDGVNRRVQVINSGEIKP